MIEIAPETACMLYVGILLITLLCTWLYHSHKARHRDIAKLTPTYIMCEYCSSSYLTESFTSLHRCPHCHCMNKSPPRANKKNS
jgi:hypothetical protein